MAFALSLLCALCPLAFGSVEPWAYAVAGSIIFVMELLQVWRGAGTRTAPLNWGLTCVLGLGLVQSLAIRIFPHPALLLPEAVSAHGVKLGLLRWGAYACAFQLALASFGSSSSRKVLLWALAATGGVVAAVGIIMRALESRLMYGVRPVGEQFGIFGPYFNRNHAAALFAMLLPLLVSWVGSSLCRLPRNGAVGKLATVVPRVLFSTFCAVLVGYAFLITGSQSVLVTLPIAVWIVTSVWMWSGSRGALRFLPLVTVCAIAVTLTILIAQDPARQSHLQRSLGVRVPIWKASIAMIGDSPWTGVGLGSFADAFPSYQSAVIPGFVEHAHNDWLELAAEIGFLGAVPVVVSLIVFFAQAFKLWVQLPSLEDKVLAGGSLSSLLGFALHGLTDFNMVIPANGLVFFVLAGWTWRLLTGPGLSTAQAGLGLRMAATAALCTGLVFNARHFVAYAWESLGAARPGAFGLSARTAACGIEPENPRCRLRLAQAIVGISTEVGQIRRALEELRQAAAIAPLRGELLRRQSELLLRLGRKEDSLELSRQAHLLEPWR